MRPIQPRVVGMSLAAAAICAGCETTPTSAVVPDVRMSVDESSVELSDSGASVRGTVVAVIANDSAGDVGFGDCSFVLEKRTALGWRTVWHSVCVLVAPPNPDPDPDRIAPGDSVTIEIAVAENASGIRWHRPIDGTYRLRMALWAEDGTGVATSNSFAVTRR